MNRTDFYIFESKCASSIFTASPTDKKNDFIIKSKLAKGNYQEIDFPVDFKHTGGKKFADILDAGWVSLYLISENLKNILEKNHITGWKTYPIRLYDKKKNEIGGYYGFSIIGVCGPLSYENSEVIYKKYAPEGPLCKVYKGKSIELEKWDGSDIFISEGTLCIILTKKVSDVLIKNKISNFKLEKFDETEMDADALDIIKSNKNDRI